MANPNRAFGLKPVRNRTGAVYNGSVTAYTVPASDATALYRGDPVQLAGSADANGRATITRATAAGGNYILGVVVGFEIDQNIRANGYRAASTLATVLVADDPELLFEIQENSATADIAAADIGLNIDLVAGSGSTTTRDSGFMAASNTKATTNTLQLKIEGVVNDGLNEIFQTGPNYQRLLVSINLHQKRNLTGL